MRETIRGCARGRHCPIPRGTSKGTSNSTYVSLDVLLDVLVWKRYRLRGGARGQRRKSLAAECAGGAGVAAAGARAGTPLVRPAMLAGNTPVVRQPTSRGDHETYRRRRPVHRLRTL